MASYEFHTSQVIAIDASAARVGGGVSRVRELVASLPTLAPGNTYALYLGPHTHIGVNSPSVRILRAPRGIGRFKGRLIWQHIYIPRDAARRRAAWLFSPFNVLPLGPGIPTSTRRAVIVSNIAPFAPEISVDLGPYQQTRLQLLRRLTIASVKRAEVVFFLSREGYRRLREHAPIRKAVFLPMAPPPPDVLSAAASLQLSDRVRARRFLVTVGDLFPYKGVEDAIQAISVLRRHGSDLQLIVCGRPVDNNYSRHLHRLAEHTAPGAVTFLEGLSQIEVLALMKASRGTIVCSRIENTSRVPVEAFAVGSPVVAADVQNSRDSCGDAVLYYPVGDSHGLAACLEQLDDDDERERLTARGKRRLVGTDWLSASREILSTMHLL